MTYVDRTIVAPDRRAANVAPDRRATHIGQDRLAASAAEPAHPELAPLLSVLFLLIDEAGPLVVNLAASHAGAGTSTIARRLAEAAAASGWCQVALLDAHPAMGAPGHGLVDAIERGERPSLLRQTLGGHDVDTGRLSTGTRPLSRIDSVRRLYGSLRDRYALVVVDCPAVSPGQQTLTMAAAADETVLVVDTGRTALADVARARAALEQRGAGVLGMVMNTLRPGRPA